MSALVLDGMGTLGYDITCNLPMDFSLAYPMDAMESLAWRRWRHTMYVRAPRAVIQARWDQRCLERASRVTTVPRAARRM